MASDRKLRTDSPEEIAQNRKPRTDSLAKKPESMNNSKRTPWSHVGDQLRKQSSAAEVVADGVQLREIDTGILTLRASTDAPVLSKALDKTLGLKLPERLAMTASKGHTIYWMSPDEWLLTCPYKVVDELLAYLRSATANHHVAIVNVSSAYCQSNLSGDHAIDVLKKSTTYDVHERNFPKGKVVNTTFSKAQATLAAIDQDNYQLFVRRSFADYIWLWLQRSAREFGLDVKTA